MILFVIGLYVGTYVAVAVFVAAWASEDYYGLHLQKGLLGALWPLWGIVGLVCLPFLIIGWLGERLGDWIDSHGSKEGN